MSSHANLLTSLRLWRWLAPALVGVALLVVYPPFRVVSRGSGGTHGGTAGAVFDPAGFAGVFWTEHLQPAAERAAGIGPIVVVLRHDPAAATRQFARKVGAGTTAYYFARGSGRVTAVERSRLLVEVDDSGGAVVALRTGPVFGNAVRDGCGLLNVNDVPGLTEFNALSAELNRLVEEQVLPALRSEAVAEGTRLAFAGCAEAPESAGGGPLLTLIPVRVEVLP